MVFINFLFTMNTSPSIVPSPRPSMCSKEIQHKAAEPRSSHSGRKTTRGMECPSNTTGLASKDQNPEGQRISIGNSGILLSFVILPCLAEHGLPEFPYSPEEALRRDRRSGLCGSAKSTFLFPRRLRLPSPQLAWTQAGDGPCWFPE